MLPKEMMLPPTTSLVSRKNVAVARDSASPAQRLLEASQALLASLENNTVVVRAKTVSLETDEIVETAVEPSAPADSETVGRGDVLAELSGSEPMAPPSGNEGAPVVSDSPPPGVPEDSLPPASESTEDVSEVLLEVDSSPPSEPPVAEPPVAEPPVEELPAETAGEDLPTVPEDETLIPTPSEEVAPPDSLPPAVLDEGGEGEEDPDADAVEEPGDPELGILRLRKRDLSLTQPPIKVPVYLRLSSSYLSNSNSRASEDPVEDQLFRSTVSLTASPILGRRTAAYATVQGNLFRYGDLSRLDYNELRFRAGVRHVLRSRVIGELGWTHRQLFFRESGDRFLSDNSVFGAISRRDPGVLGPKTSLNSFYRVRASFADPKTSNRVVNTLGTTLSYDVTPRLKASLTGLGVITSFTRQSRHDVYGQALASLSYTLAKNTRLSLFAALNRGGSVDDRVDFDNALLGVSFSSSLKLF